MNLKLALEDVLNILLQSTVNYKAYSIVVSNLEWALFDKTMAEKVDAFWQVLLDRNKRSTDPLGLVAEQSLPVILEPWNKLWAVIGSGINDEKLKFDVLNSVVIQLLTKELHDRSIASIPRIQNFRDEDGLGECIPEFLKERYETQSAFYILRVHKLLAKFADGKIKSVIAGILSKLAENLDKEGTGYYRLVIDMPAMSKLVRSLDRAALRNFNPPDPLDAFKTLHYRMVSDPILLQETSIILRTFISEDKCSAELVKTFISLFVDGGKRSLFKFVIDNMPEEDTPSSLSSSSVSFRQSLGVSRCKKRSVKPPPAKKVQTKCPATKEEQFKHPSAKVHPASSKCQAKRLSAKKPDQAKARKKLILPSSTAVTQQVEIPFSFCNISTVLKPETAGAISYSRLLHRPSLPSQSSVIFHQAQAQSSHNHSQLNAVIPNRFLRVNVLENNSALKVPSKRCL